MLSGCFWLTHKLFFLEPTVKETSQTNIENKVSSTKPTTMQSFTLIPGTHSTMLKHPLTETNFKGGKEFVFIDSKVGSQEKVPFFKYKSSSFVSLFCSQDSRYCHVG